MPMIRFSNFAFDSSRTYLYSANFLQMVSYHNLFYESRISWLRFDIRSFIMINDINHIGILPIRIFFGCIDYPLPMWCTVCFFKNNGHMITSSYLNGSHNEANKSRGLVLWKNWKVVSDHYRCLNIKKEVFCWQIPRCFSLVLVSLYESAIGLRTRSTRIPNTLLGSVNNTRHMSPLIRSFD